MYITRKYIMDNRTERGAWTKPQIEALGLNWPPRKGWIDKVCGREISNSQRIQFESKLGIKKVRKLRKGTDFFLAEKSFDIKKTEALKRYAERMEKR